MTFTASFLLLAFPEIPKHDLNSWCQNLKNANTKFPNMNTCYKEFWTIWNESFRSHNYVCMGANGEGGSVSYIVNQNGTYAYSEC